MSTSMIEKPKIVSRDEWLAARKNFWRRDAAHPPAQMLIAAERRQPSMGQNRKNYVFDSPGGKKTLAELFGRQKPSRSFTTLCSVPTGRKAAPVAPSIWTTRTERFVASGAARRFFCGGFPGTHRKIQPLQESAWDGSLHLGLILRKTTSTTIIVLSFTRGMAQGQG